MAPTDTWQEFVTVRDPARFQPDWSAFYHRMSDRSSEVRRERHPDLLAYGNDPFQRVHLYIGSPAARTLVMFVHGGGWREGHPSVYDVVLEPWLHAGAAACANIGYRYLPGADIHESTDDVARGIGLALEAARDRGIGVGRVVLIGHSAGACMLASVVLHASRFPIALPTDVVFVGVSGVYDLLNLRSRPNLTRAQQTHRAAINPVTPSEAIARLVVLSYGVTEMNLVGGRPDHFAREAHALTAAIDALPTGHRRPVVVDLPLSGPDHVGTVDELLDPRSPLGAVCLGLVSGDGCQTEGPAHPEQVRLPWK